MILHIDGFTTYIEECFNSPCTYIYFVYKDKGEQFVSACKTNEEALDKLFQEALNERF